MLDQGFDVEGIVQHLIDEFVVDEARAADEVKDLLLRFHNEGLLTG